MTMAESPAGSRPRFCSACGTQFHPDALFCHNCGAPVGGTGSAADAGSISPFLRWGLPAVAIVALVVLTMYRSGSSSPAQVSEAQTPLASGGIAPPDISSMSPEE